MDKVTVIMPAHNEAMRILNTIIALKSLKTIGEIIVVDDGSTDDTYVICEKAGVTVYRLEKNLGKGEALNYGIKKATGNIIAFLDADLGDSGREAKKIIDPVLKGQADVTIAKFPKATKKGGFGFVKRLARWGVKLHTGKTITSILSGQRVFRKEVLDELYPLASGYGVEVAMTIKILKKGFSIKEVDVNMTHAETGRDLKGFLHRFKQFVNIFKVIITYKD